MLFAQKIPKLEMPIVGAFVFPHGAITLDPDTRDLTKQPAYLPTTKENCLKLHSDMRSQAETLVSTRPDLIILSTPHGLRLQNSFVFLGNGKASGSAEWDGEWTEYTAECTVDLNITTYIMETLRGQDNNVETITVGAPAVNSLPLNWGEAIPLWFINEAFKSQSISPPPLISVGIPTKRSSGTLIMIPELLKLGTDIWGFIKTNLYDKRVAIVISCDLSHYHSTDPTSPYHFDEDAVPFDHHCVSWAKISIDKDQLPPNSPSNQRLLTDGGNLADHIGSCGYTGLVILQGILTACAGDSDPNVAQKFQAFYLGYSWPTYYGMMVNHFLPVPKLE